jgi:deoxyribodipyrimidine photo-lyase
VPRTAIAWFRRDLRLADNPALVGAVAAAAAVVPLFVVAPAGAPHAPGVASRTWLSASLESLAESLRIRGNDLLVRYGSAADEVLAVARAARANLVICNRDWTPRGLAEERTVAEALRAHGIELRVAESQLLVTPGALRGGGGGAYRVFTPYWHAWRGAWRAEMPLAAPERIPGATLAGVGVGERVSRAVATGSLVGLQAPASDSVLSAAAVAHHWTPGECGAAARLGEFAADGVASYAQRHDLPAEHGTSELSPHLAWGEVSPRQVAWTVVRAHPRSAITDAKAVADAEPFLRQLAWREFAHEVAHARPEMLDEPLRPEFCAMAWRDDTEAMAAWLGGRTGFPLVDAGMRQLAATGWMHNRVRMVAASWLVKDVLVGWQDGERAFSQALVDFDPVLNAFNWQWVAGSGADAAPYFRIFNPTLQGTRFDSAGDYVRRWVPELAELPARWIHRPAEAPAEVLVAAGVGLDTTYPRPVVDHAEARVRALAAFSAVRERRATSSSS